VGIDNKGLSAHILVRRPFGGLDPKLRAGSAPLSYRVTTQRLSWLN